MEDRKSQRFGVQILGYTLIELLIVLTIIGFLFVGGYTAYRDFARRQVLNTVADEVKSGLNVARQKALGAERPSAGECFDEFLGYSVLFTTSSFTISPDCDRNDPGALSSFVTLRQTPAVVRISVTGTTTANRILFKGLGLGTDVAAGGAAITLTHTDSGNTKVISVSQSGIIK